MGYGIISEGPCLVTPEVMTAPIGDEASWGIVTYGDLTAARRQIHQPGPCDRAPVMDGSQSATVGLGPAV
jgi:hypothetical protein